MSEKNHRILGLIRLKDLLYGTSIIEGNDECILCSLLTDSNNSSALPVVMFVHCESYTTGTGNAYDGSVLAAFGRVVVVTVNFRLGVLGKNFIKYCCLCF